MIRTSTTVVPLSRETRTRDSFGVSETVRRLWRLYRLNRPSTSRSNLDLFSRKVTPSSIPELLRGIPRHSVESTCHSVEVTNSVNVPHDTPQSPYLPSCTAIVGRVSVRVTQESFTTVTTLFYYRLTNKEILEDLCTVRVEYTHSSDP